MNNILNNHPGNEHPFGIALTANDTVTDSGVPHRELQECGHNDILLDFMLKAIEKHHTTPKALERHMKLIQSLHIKNLDYKPKSLFPKTPSTQKGNFGEIFLAEYIAATSDAELPVYRLRYNPNPNQSMKGDDVLMFDLDSDPVRIIVGESKFRQRPDKDTVLEMVKELVASNRLGIPASLNFVANILYDTGQEELGEKISECSLLFAEDKLKIDYIGLFMSNHNVKNTIKKHTQNQLHNLLVISLSIEEPFSIIKTAFDRLEKKYE